MMLNPNNPKCHGGKIRLVNGVMQFYAGSEGPRHDPYAYDELVLTRTPPGADKPMTITLHIGLSTYVKIDDQILRSVPNEFRHLSDPDDAWEKTFEKLSGLSLEKWNRAYHRVKSRCPKCGCREWDLQEGYPGESFRTCADCRTVIDTYFNESAIL